MEFDNSKELALEYASREYIMANADIEQHLTFIKEQIKHPFDNGDYNHFNKMMRLIIDKNIKQEYAKKVIDMIMQAYDNIEVEPEEDVDLIPIAKTLYKFFTINLKSVAASFLREFLYNNKNRRVLLSRYQDMKIQSYPKEQYGSKDNYILIIKLPSIVKDIMDLDIDLKEFIDYAFRNNDRPHYIDKLIEMIDTDVISDYNIYSDIMNKLKKSDSYDGVINKLQMKMVSGIIQPEMIAKGYDAFASVIDVDDDETDADEDENNEDYYDNDVDDTPMKVDDYSDD